MNGATQPNEDGRRSYETQTENDAILPKHRSVTTRQKKERQQERSPAGRTTRRRRKKREPPQPRTAVSHLERRARQENDDNYSQQDSSYSESDDDDDDMPGAVRIGGDLESGAGEDSVVDRFDTNEENDGNVQESFQEAILEADLVEDRTGITDDERRRIEEETRARVYDELGNLTEAHIVEDDKRGNDPTVSKYILLLRAGICLVLIVVISVVLGILLGPKNESVDPAEVDTVPNAQPTPTLGVPSSFPSIWPTDPIPINSQCYDAAILKIGEIVNATVHPNVVSGLGCFSAANLANPSLELTNAAFYYWQGTGQPVQATVAQSPGQATLSVYFISSDFPDCQYQENCSPEAIYTGSRSASFVAQRGQDYLLQVYGYDLVPPEPSSPLKANNFVQVEFHGNNMCGTALGPILPTGINSIFPGSIIDPSENEDNNDDAALSIAPVCGTASEWLSDVGGAWYLIQGNGKFISVSTCFLTDLDTQISVFFGSCLGTTSETTLTCIDGNNDHQTCGSQSLVALQSVPLQEYYILVQANRGTAVSSSSSSTQQDAITTTGDFRLQIRTEDEALLGNFCSTARAIELNKTLSVPFFGATEDPEVTRICLLTCASFIPAAIWHRVDGTGGRMMATVNDASFIQILLLTGSSCSNNLVGLPGTCCETKTCNDHATSNSIEWMSQVGETYYIVINYIDVLNRLNEASVLLTVTGL